MDRIYKGKKLDEKISEYTVVDIETTGLSPANSKIIEIAAVKVRDGDIVDTFQELVNPEEKLSSFTTHLTGITNSMVQEAEKIDSVIMEFQDFVGESVIVGHNVNFDINFLYDNLYSVNGSYLSNNYVDTMYMGRKLLPELPNHKLESLTKHFNVSYDGAHRALNDCMFTYKCYEKMKDMI